MAEFRWYGHNCFRIRGKDATVLTDPVGGATGYALSRQTADVVTLSHDDPDHANLGAIKGDFALLSGPGEYEVRDLFVTGVRTYRDAVKGAEKGRNTVYLIEIDGMTVCHLGDLGHPLTAEQAEAMPDVDVLLVAAGGDLAPARVAEVVAQIEPKLVVPMQFRTAAGDRDRGDLDAFVKELGVEAPEPEEKLTVRPGELGETMQMAVLKPSH